MVCYSSCQPFPSVYNKDNIRKIWSPEIYSVWMVSQTFVKRINIIEFIINIYAHFYRIVKYASIMIMRSLENQIHDSLTTMAITAQRLFHLV